ncbi:hypothetical protein, partial [Desulfobacula sp.]|uniref:hypothetical protein n=1 Tax=Desulfobacula sp. TaxID=2593537 RepID=UPI0039B84A07
DEWRHGFGQSKLLKKNNPIKKQDMYNQRNREKNNPGFPVAMKRREKKISSVFKIFYRTHTR